MKEHPSNKSTSQDVIKYHQIGCSGKSTTVDCAFGYVEIAIAY
jgi:hypothetical protein